MPAIKLDFFVRVEFEFILREQVVHINGMLLKPVGVTLVDHKGGREVGLALSAGRQHVQVRAEVGELCEIGLEKIFVTRIQRVDVAVVKFRG